MLLLGYAEFIRRQIDGAWSDRSMSGEYFARKSFHTARAPFTGPRLKNVRLTQMRYLF